MADVYLSSLTIFWHFSMQASCLEIMPGQHSKSKVRLTLRIDRKLDLAIRLDAARQKTDRTKWFIRLAEKELRSRGRWP